MVNNSLIIQVIILTAVVMMAGMMGVKKEKVSNPQQTDTHAHTSS